MKLFTVPHHWSWSSHETIGWSNANIQIIANIKSVTKILCKLTKIQLTHQYNIIFYNDNNKRDNNIYFYFLHKNNLIRRYSIFKMTVIFFYW